MHYDNSRDESQVNAPMNFIKMHKNPFCYDAATDVVSCSLECYLVVKTCESLSELDNKSLYTLCHVQALSSPFLPSSVPYGQW